MAEPTKPLPAHIQAAAQCRENVIIFDMNNEYGEYDIRTIHTKDIALLVQHPVKQIRRIVPFRKNEKGKTVKLKINEMLKLLEITVEEFKNGALVIEDPSKFMAKTISEDIIGSICTNRHSSVDIIMHYQSISRPLPIIHENCNIYRFHHQADDVYRSEGKLQEATEAFKICQIIVDTSYFSSRNPKDPCKRKFVYYIKDYNIIAGGFTEVEFNEALDKYIEINPKKIKLYENKRDHNTGEKVYPDYKSAYKACKQELYNMYYGNDIMSAETIEREAIFMVASGLKGVGKTRESMRHIFDDYCQIPRPAIFNK